MDPITMALSVCDKLLDPGIGDVQRTSTGPEKRDGCGPPSAPGSDSRARGPDRRESHPAAIVRALAFFLGGLAIGVVLVYALILLAIRWFGPI
jgi:hypothetical protein